MTKNKIYNLDAFLKTFGTAIKKKREELQITQEKMSELTGLEYKYYQRIEYGEKNITLKTVLKICEALEIEVKELFE